MERQILRVLAIAFLFQISLVASTELERIINGKEAETEQFPYQVFFDVEHNGTWDPTCGGTLISNRVVLTAAHCVDEKFLHYDYEYIRIYFGAVNRLNRTEVGQQRLVLHRRYIQVHYDWDIINYLNDIALINLPADLLLDNYIQPAKLPKRYLDYSNKKVVTSGWGSTTGERSERSPVLRYTYGSTLTNNECKTSVLQAMSKNAVDNDFIFSPTLICLAASESNPCYGESGGPLVLNEQTEQSTIIGIASRATHPFCAPGNPVLYTRVSAYLDWIKENSYR